MSLARTLGVALVGVRGIVVSVEAHVGSGLPNFILVGLPDTALSESRDRVRAAIVNSGWGWPNRRITVSLSPASLPKAGAHFDLAVAIGILAGADVLPVELFARAVVIGELGLDGRVRSVRGVLPAVLAAAAAGVECVWVPEANVREARLVPGIEIVAARSLRQVVARARGEEEPDEAETQDLSRSAGPAPPPPVAKDLADVLGQAEGRHAVEVCAAGGHNLFLVGPPGAGKTMLAERLPGLLPELDRASALEVTAIHSLAGALEPGSPLIERAPLQSPHHTATQASIVGGGSGALRPGMASLAHRGVLFMDEAPEFSRHVLDALRQPVEAGEVVIARSIGVARFPARFQLILAANPCPCGQAYGKGLRCTCTPFARSRYLAKLSGPLLDRVDLRVALQPVDRTAMLADLDVVEHSAVVAGRVREARARAARRLAGTPWRTNAEVPGPELRRRFRPGAATTARLEIVAGGLSGRGFDRVMRVAWTLCDLAGRATPAPADVDAAVFYRVNAISAA